MVTIFFGAVLIDVAYARLVPFAPAAFSEVSDLLLLFSVINLLAAVGAIALSWKFSTARNLFFASLAILVVEFLAPAFFTGLSQGIHGSGWTTALRLVLNGSASVLAFIGLKKLYRRSSFTAAPE